MVSVIVAAIALRVGMNALAIPLLFVRFLFLLQSAIWKNLMANYEKTRFVLNVVIKVASFFLSLVKPKKGGSK